MVFHASLMPVPLKESIPNQLRRSHFSMNVIARGRQDFRLLIEQSDLLCQ